jgi:hypothetical protein
MLQCHSYYGMGKGGDGRGGRASFGAECGVGENPAPRKTKGGVLGQTEERFIAQVARWGGGPPSLPPQADPSLGNEGGRKKSACFARNDGVEGRRRAEESKPPPLKTKGGAP